MPTESIQYAAAKACSLHNEHTSPVALRSHWEHACHRRAARKVRKWIDRNCPGFVRETESGRLTTAF